MKNLSDINVIRSVMAKHGVTFNKGLGQNFLVDESVINRILDEVNSEDTVLEIGPGAGFVTENLVNKA